MAFARRPPSPSHIQRHVIQKRRILLVDDHLVFLRHATKFLNAHEPLQVVGTATSAADGVTQAAALNPDVILLDISMPGGSGLDVVPILKALPASPRVIVLSSESAGYAGHARALGADAFVSKSDMVDTIVDTIEDVMHGPAAG